jgi:hypothetical protein
VLEADGSYPDQEANAKTITKHKQHIGDLQLKQRKLPSQRFTSITSDGRHSSAWRRSTEKPPCVLVSEAVSVLQKECTRGLTGGADGVEDTSSVQLFSSCS